MSISPPSDIILDVVNAANPVKQLAAVNRLEKLAQGRSVQPAPSASFVKVLKNQETAQVAPAKSIHSQEKNTVADSKSLPTATREVLVNKMETPLEKAHRKLEGVFLQGMINSMLSGQKGTMYGKGIAGSYWKSFMAEAIANQLVKGKGIGIAESFSNENQAAVFQRSSASTLVSANADYRYFFQKVFMDEVSTSGNS